MLYIRTHFTLVLTTFNVAFVSTAVSPLKQAPVCRWSGGVCRWSGGVCRWSVVFVGGRVVFVGGRVVFVGGSPRLCLVYLRHGN